MYTPHCKAFATLLKIDREMVKRLMVHDLWTSWNTWNQLPIGHTSYLILMTIPNRRCEPLLRAPIATHFLGTMGDNRVRWAPLVAYKWEEFACFVLSLPGALRKGRQVGGQYTWVKARHWPVDLITNIPADWPSCAKRIPTRRQWPQFARLSSDLDRAAAFTCKCQGILTQSLSTALSK